jgi:hypothetical protein
MDAAYKQESDLFSVGNGLNVIANVVIDVSFEY